MYEAHFGLHGRPFDTGIAHEVDVFRGERQNTIIDRTKLALAASDSVVTFSGPPGIGKTTLALSAVRSTSTRLALAWLSSMPTNANELLELLLVELGVNAHRASRIERLQMWRQYLGEMSATASRVFVIAERTEELAPEVLRALDSLTGADASGSTGANVVLIGHQGLDGFLGSPSLESLRQRIRLRQRLEPFSPAELTDYLRHRVTQAGGDFDRLFAPGAAAAVYRHSAGVARLANTLCEAALTGAAAAHKPTLTPELIAQVAVDILGVGEQSTAPATPNPPTAVAAPSAPVAAAAPVTFTSVAIDLTPAKTAVVVVAAPKTASAAPVATSTKPIDAMPAPAPQPAAPVAAAAASVPQPTITRLTPVISPPPAPIPPTVTAPPPTALAAKPIAPRRPPPDFDATATDIPDVSSFDFPVLMDAVEDIAPRAPVVRAPLAPPAPRAPIPPAARPTGAAPPPPRRLLEPKSAAPSAAPPPPAPAVQVEEDPDALRQTQAVRAISQAKSIDDVSDSMAETLFGDAELDFLSATLASAIGEEPRAGAPATSAAPTPPPAPPPEELMDLFNLGPDAPLELIDDSAAPQTDRRKTVRR